MNMQQEQALRGVFEYMVKGGAAPFLASMLLVEISPGGEYDNLVYALRDEFQAARDEEFRRVTSTTA